MTVACGHTGGKSPPIGLAPNTVFPKALFATSFIASATILQDSSATSLKLSCGKKS